MLLLILKFHRLQAFPGVLIGMGGIAVLMRYSFPYSWTWTQCLLFGAMMAATDPVATVAVLGNVRPHFRLQMLCKLFSRKHFINSSASSTVHAPSQAS